jgi:hypothetical protein
MKASAAKAAEAIGNRRAIGYGMTHLPLCHYPQHHP